jgi:hypothetical protein
MVRPAGLEPATLGLEGQCSIHLSYGRVPFKCSTGTRAWMSKGQRPRVDVVAAAFGWIQRVRRILRRFYAGGRCPGWSIAGREGFFPGGFDFIHDLVTQALGQVTHGHQVAMAE